MYIYMRVCVCVCVTRLDKVEREAKQRVGDICKYRKIIVSFAKEPCKIIGSFAEEPHCRELVIFAVAKETHLNQHVF